jgi:hypothetical protein
MEQPAPFELGEEVGHGRRRYGARRVVGTGLRVRPRARRRRSDGRCFRRRAAVILFHMSEETYDEGRRRNLEALLLALAARIQELDREGDLLSRAGELIKLIGDVRSELFHYEVRATYDTPEIAESRRIVSEAQSSTESAFEPSEWPGDEEDGPPW